MDKLMRPSSYLKIFYAVITIVAVLLIYPSGKQTSGLSEQARRISKIASTQITKNGLEVTLSDVPEQLEKLGKLLSGYSKDRIQIEAPPENIELAYRAERILFDEGVSSDNLDVAGIASRNAVVLVIQS